MLTPREWGLPEKFVEWREGQFDAVNFVLDSPQRFVCLCAPTGWGKSLGAMAMAQLSGKRTVILTSTKGLQDQYKDDYLSISSDIRGMQNYLCDAAVKFGMPPYTKVSDGPCHHGAHCSLRQSGCGYFDAYRDAQAASIVVTNYQCWMHDRGGLKQGLDASGPVEMLMLDEAHDSESEVSSFLSVQLERKECMGVGMSWPKSGYEQQQWQDWAKYHLDKLEEEIEDLQLRVKSDGASHAVLHQIRELKDMTRKLERVAGMEEEWVIEELGKEEDTMKAAQFDPLWPRKYAEKVLFRGIPKIVLISATIRPKTAELLGVPKDKVAFREYPSSFPADRRPVIHVPTVRMNWRTERDDSQMMWWLRKIDNLISARQDRKGVIHTVSYKRMHFLVDNSKHRDRMMIHGSDTRADVIQRFLRAGPGTVLVSPSVDTGYDFHDDLAEYQIIGKIPFQDTRGVVIKARNKSDRDYGLYITCQTVQQMTGRLMRSPEDRGETLCVDDNILWVVGKYKHFFNRWWLDSFRSQKGRLPDPPPKL